MVEPEKQTEIAGVADIDQTKDENGFSRFKIKRIQQKQYKQGVRFNGNKSRILYFNSGFCMAHNVEAYTAVELFVDKQNKMLAIRFCNDAPSESIAKISGNSKSGRFIAVSSFLDLAKKYGYKFETTLEVEDKGDGILLIKKGE